MVIASLKNLIMEFGDRRVIDNVSVLCEEGAVIGLIGGIDSGLISIGSGIFGGLVLLFVEILCLK
jgi:ABC-type branched-subunit amino acid transport system ATPase component